MEHSVKEELMDLIQGLEVETLTEVLGIQLFLGRKFIVRPWKI